MSRAEIIDWILAIALLVMMIAIPRILAALAVFWGLS